VASTGARTAPTLIALGLLVSVFQTDGLSPMELLLLLLHDPVFLDLHLVLDGVHGIFDSVRAATAGPFPASRPAPPDPTAPPPRTAILMPIYNEDSERVFAGLRAIHQSLADDRPKLDGFDFFILSDTRDPDVWVEEELRWQDMVRALDGKGRIFYRNRPENTSPQKRQSGRFLHPLGRAVSLHDRAGCRQHHERQKRWSRWCG
jgi:membrane glycosyltransferase